jgi:hypothetical protein
MGTREDQRRRWKMKEGEKMARGNKGRSSPFIMVAVDLCDEGEWEDGLLWGLLCWEISTLNPGIT